MNLDDALNANRGELVAAAGRWQSSRRRSRRRRGAAAVAVLAVLAAVLVATPAWALVRDVLPFWSQPSAPQSVQVDFDQMLNVGAPAGMDPQAASGETREVMQATFGGKTHTLYVSPAKNGGYCELWTDASGGCNTAGEPLTWATTIVPPHDASQPAQTVISKSEMTNLPQTGVAYWLVGDVLSSDVSYVVIRFSDGSSVKPPITWVSDPIDAGFFAYDIPNDEQTAADHATEIDAYDSNGALVKQNTIQPAG